MSDLNDLLPVILGAGGAGFIAAATQAYSAWRSGAEARESKALRNLERWRDEADRRAELYLTQLDHERRWGSYWRQWAGTLEYALRQAGIDLPPRPPEPPPPRDDLTG